MTYLILMLMVAAAMMLFCEPLGRALVKAMDAINWKWAVLLALLMLLIWGILHHVQAPISVTGDALSGMFDTFAYGDILFTYADLVLGAAVVLLSRQSRHLLSRTVGLARLAAHRVVRRASRAARTHAKPRLPPPDPEEPEGFGGLPAYA